MSKRQLTENIEKARHQIQSGRLDKENGLTPGTLSSLMSNYQTADHAVRPLTDDITRYGSAIVDVSNLRGMLGREARRSKIYEIEELGRRIQKYGVPPAGIVVPEQIRKTKHNLHAERMTDTNAMRRFGIKSFAFSRLIRQAELEAMLRNAGAPEKDVPKLPEIFGKENFIEPGEEHLDP